MFVKKAKMQQIYSGATMKCHRTISLVALCWLVAQSEGFAQGEINVSKVGTTAAPFLEIGVGARAVSMGGAFVATANDATALYWNPGGISRLQRPQAILVHTQWLADINFDYVGLVIPIGGFGTIGGSATSLSMDEMVVRTEVMPQGTGERFSAGDLALQLSYGLNLTDRFSIGFNVKYVHQRIWKETASGFAIDIGTLFTTGLNNMRIGAALSNFGTDMKMSGDDLVVNYDVDPTQLGNNDRVFADLRTDQWPLPLTFQAGVAMELWQAGNSRLTVAADATHPVDNTESIHLGGEFSWRETLFFRGGLRNLFLRDGEEGATFGFGLATRFLGNFKVQADYAYADFGRLENAERFSLAVEF